MKEDTMKQKTVRKAKIVTSPKKLLVSVHKEQKTHLYDEDFYKWTKTQASLLKSKKAQLSDLDIKNLIEEIESLGISDKRSLKNHLINLLMHLLKKEYQPEKHTRSWDKSIQNARIQINLLLEDSPSLKQEIKKEYKSAYEYARKKANVETGLDIEKFPSECPWNIKDVL
jgi:Domain of unknown function DUF29